MCSSNSSVLPTDVLEDDSFAMPLNHLLEVQAHVDVTFVLESKEGDTEFFAHKLILSMRSPYFEDKFYGGESNEESHTIRLKKFNPQALKDMIRYCYGVKPRLETPEQSCELFKLGKDFQIVGLMNLCRKSLRDTKIEPKNVFIVLDVARYTEDQTLQDRCNKLIEEKTREVMAAYELQDVTNSMVYAVMDLPKLSLYSEYELIRWLFDWGKVKAEEVDSNCETSRQYLEKFLLDMNFSALTLEEFACLDKDFPGFFSDDEIVSIFMNKHIPNMRKMPDFYNKDVKIRAYTGSKQ